MSQLMSSYLKTSELAKRYGKSTRTIQRWAKAGKLGRVQKGRRALRIDAKTHRTGASAKRPVKEYFGPLSAAEVQKVLVVLIAAVQFDEQRLHNVANWAKGCLDRKHGRMRFRAPLHTSITVEQMSAAAVVAARLTGAKPSEARLRYCCGDILARLLASVPRRSEEARSLAALTPAILEMMAGAMPLDEYFAIQSLAATRPGGKAMEKMGKVVNAEAVRQYEKLKRSDARERNEFQPSARSIARLARLSRHTVAGMIGATPHEKSGVNAPAGAPADDWDIESYLSEIAPTV